MKDDHNAILVSVIIPSHNRFDSLENAIVSVKNQTHKNIELIIINDSSSDERYLNNQIQNIQWIHLSESSINRFGYPCPGFVRNQGLSIAKGDYIAFLDDDDYWFPEKIKTQLSYMIQNDFSMSCSEALIGPGKYDHAIKYPHFYAEFFKDFCIDFFKTNFDQDFSVLPNIFTSELIIKHNFVINSSVLLKRNLLTEVGHFKEIPIAGCVINGVREYEDWELWKRCLLLKDCYYINEPLLFYSDKVKKKRNRFLRFLQRSLRFCYHK